MLSAFAQFDNDARSERTEAGMRAALERGRWPFLAPIGYLNKDRGLVLDDERAPLVRQAMEMAVEGQRQTSILRRMRAAGLTSREGRKLSAESLSRMLRNPIYAGIVEVNQWGIRTRGDFPSIVDEATFEAAQRALDRRKHRASIHKRFRPDFPLRHFVRCGKCARPMTASWSTGRKGKYGYYRCPAKNCRNSIPKGTLESAFTALLDRLRPKRSYLRLFKEVVLDTIKRRRQDSTALEAQLRLKEERLSRKRDQLTDAFLYREVIDDATYQEELSRLDQQIEAIRSERHDTELGGLDIEGLLHYAEHVAMNAGTLWRDANLEQRLRLQRFWFPTGVTWSDGAVGTGVTSLFFSELATETSGDQGWRP